MNKVIRIHALIALAAVGGCTGNPVALYQGEHLERSDPPISAQSNHIETVELTPEQEEARRSRQELVLRRREEGDAARLRGDLERAEELYLEVPDAGALKTGLQALYLRQGRWQDLLDLTLPIMHHFNPERNKLVVAVAYYSLGNTANGDRYAPREAVDCGVWFTYDRQTHERDERPNKPVLDSPRKREAAAWHALAVHGVVADDRVLDLLAAEKAARMFPDEPAFSYVYARALDSNGYATGALEQYERSVRNSRGYFVDTLDETIRVARFHAGKPYDRGRRP